MKFELENVIVIILVACILYTLWQMTQGEKFNNNLMDYRLMMRNVDPRKIKRHTEFRSPNLLDHQVKIDCSGDLGLRTDNFEQRIPQNPNRCVVDSMNDEVRKFAVQSRCDCDRTHGCSVCTLKHTNDHAIASKLCQKSPESFDCVVSAMENDNNEYMKKLMTGPIIESSL